ncbi:hypothetical protein ACFLRX_00300 [Acidobacteriota bacterium]
MKKNTKYLFIMALILSIVVNYGCPALFGYNVVGTWSITATYGEDTIEDYTVSFAGDKKTGTVTWTYAGYGTLTGTYSVNGKNITFEVGDAIELDSYSGTFRNNKEMSGTGTLLWYSDAAPGVRKMKRLQSRVATALSESEPFTWVGFKN